MNTDGKFSNSVYLNRRMD